MLVIHHSGLDHLASINPPGREPASISDLRERTLTCSLTWRFGQLPSNCKRKELGRVLSDLIFYFHSHFPVPPSFSILYFSVCLFDRHRAHHHTCCFLSLSDLFIPIPLPLNQTANSNHPYVQKIKWGWFDLIVLLSGVSCTIYWWNCFGGLFIN